LRTIYSSTHSQGQTMNRKAVSKLEFAKHATSALFCVVLACMTGFAAYEQQNERSWTKVTATVLNNRTSSEDRHSKFGMETFHSLFLTCEYKVGSSTYKKELQEEEDKSSNVIQLASEKYHPGSTIAVHYNPADASQCALDPAVGKDKLQLWQICTGLFALMAILSFFEAGKSIQLRY